MTLHCGDNMGIMRAMEHESVDLIYLDPPFFTQKDWGDFDDHFESMDDYISWLRIRMLYARRLLKPTGSIYLHCDWHAAHYVKVMMDDVFGYDNFQNEIIWSYERWPLVQRRYQRMHDNIFFYTKSDDYTYNEQYRSAGNTKQIMDDGYTTGHNKNGKFLIVYDAEKARHEIRNPKYYEVKYEVYSGTRMSDVWQIKCLATSSNDRVGYSTQKPTDLLERIILSSSNEGDVVLDPFMGSGTTCVVAHKLGRRYIGIDKNPDAIKLCEQRIPDTYQQNLATQYRCEVI